MHNYRKIYPSFWAGKTACELRELGNTAHFMAINLITNAHTDILGIYHLPIPYLAHDIAISAEEATAALNKLCVFGFCRYDEKSKYIWVINMAKYQIEEALKPQDNRVKHIQTLYDLLPELPFLTDFYKMYVAYLHLKPRSTQKIIQPLSLQMDHALLRDFIKSSPIPVNIKINCRLTDNFTSTLKES